MARRQHLTLTLLAVMLFLSLTYFMAGRSSVEYSPKTRLEDAALPTDPDSNDSNDSAGDGFSATDISDRILQGGSIAPKLGNATAKAELGRASWKLLHTMMARFPETPTPDDSLALETYMRLFARLYPCGECAAHFQKLLRKYPPQTSGRNAAAGWACFVHNEVNKRLKKEEFDCNKIGDFYDCGCGDEGGKKEDGGKKEEAGGEGGEAAKGDELKGREGVTVEKEEGLTRGG
ncbi:ERV/ALR sulfhydryl oxidase domain-containing protein [Chaetomium fimeti]|uniref:Sulfhydryl oxidase n=1 Tax=Chaetomium fimeti TaxID=1854472 RepID=A0AAE0H8S0_9PEZI|nr:ERV/ALR sulfhydryl oxidase domain-containing protein [Chaetomium fimeti]